MTVETMLIVGKQVYEVKSVNHDREGYFMIIK